MKSCTKCHQTKPLEEFYRMARMADARFNKCKECTKSDARSYYAKNKKARAAYDRSRNKKPDRRKRRAESARRYYDRNHAKSICRTKTKRAIKSGRLVRQPCETCGKLRRGRTWVKASAPNGYVVFLGTCPACALKGG